MDLRFSSTMFAPSSSAEVILRCRRRGKEERLAIIRDANLAEEGVSVAVRGHHQIETLRAEPGRTIPVSSRKVATILTR